MPKQVNVDRCVSFSSLLSMLIGLTGLMGWALHIEILKSILPGQVTMKANTAICLMLIGLSVWWQRAQCTGRVTEWIAKTLAAIVTVVGLLSFLEFLGGWDFRIDQLLFAETAEQAIGAVRPGLMSPLTAVNFALLGLALLFLSWTTAEKGRQAQFLGLASGAISVLALLDFILKPHAFHTHMALPTVLALCLLSFAVVCARPVQGIAPELFATGFGAGLRRLWRDALAGGPAWRTPMRYGLAVLLVSLATVLRHFPSGIPKGLTYVTYFPAIMIAALIGGAGPGILAALLSVICADYFFLSPTGQFGNKSLSEITGLFMATGVGMGMSWVAGAVDRMRKRTGEESRRAKEEWELTFDSVPEAVMVLDAQFCIQRCNKAMAELVNLPADAVVGKHCFELVHQQTAPISDCPLRQMLQSGNQEEREITDARSGKVFDITATPLGAGERLHGCVHVIRDITERKQAEERLRKGSLYARSLLEASLDPLVTINRDGKITDVNEATETATGMGRDRLIGSDFSDYFTEPAKARQGYQQVFAEGLVKDYPLAIRHSSGRVIDVLYNATVFRNEQGEVDGVFAAARDITEREQAEQEIRKLNLELEDRVQQRTAQLRESEHRVRRKLNSILSPEGDIGSLELADLLDVAAVQSLAEDFYKLTSIPMFILDMNGNPLVAAGWQEVCTRFHRVHPEACKNCSESDRELSEGVAPGEFKLYKCKNNMWDVVTPIIVGGKKVGNLFSGQFFFDDEPLDYAAFRSQAKRYGFDEKDYIAALESAPQLSREAVDTGMAFFVKFAQLLSQLSYSSIKLARSMEDTSRINDQLLATVQELEAFTYSVSHDLRAPLRHISGFSKLLTEEFASQLPEEAQHHLQRIEDGTRRMGLLVDDLLNLARIGRRDVASQVCGLRSIVDEVIGELKPECEGRQIEWKIGNLPFVECDSGLMKQVFQNLLSNALKFTRPRAQAVIEIGQQEQEGVPVIYFRDNGVGFSMKYADKLFGVFQRLHRQEDFEGTGVGLATVQRIIQKHGGRVWAQAELDKGATFYFTLGRAEQTELKAKAAVGEEK